MKFDSPAQDNPIDQLRVVGKPTPRIDGPLKVTGTAPYAYEYHDVAENVAYGVVVGAAIAKGRIASMDLRAARAAPGVVAIVTADNAGLLEKSKHNAAKLLGGPEIDHYHQAIAVVVADTLEQAQHAAQLLHVEYAPAHGRFDLAQARDGAPLTGDPDGDEEPKEQRVGDFEKAFASAAVQLDATYTTPDQTHAMMEPHATLAVWDGGQLTVWTSNQMVDYGRTDLASTLGIARERVRLLSPYVGGGFGGKLFLRSDVLLAALGARAAQRPVKVALERPLVINNTTHRPATIQRIRLGADAEGRLMAIAQESWSGNLPDGDPETAVNQTRLLYAGANRLAAMRLAVLDLPEGNSMRAPGDAAGMMALEIAIDEMAEKLEMDPVEFRILNDTQVDPGNPERKFSRRAFVECLREGASRFGWHARKAKPGSLREGQWRVGHGVAAAFRNNLTMTSAARVRLETDGGITVETDMTDIGTGSYTIIAQTAAEMMGVELDRVTVRLGDSNYPVSSGSGGQFGGASSTSGVYAACVKLREMIAERAGLHPGQATFVDGHVRGGNRSVPLTDFAAKGALMAEDKIEWGELDTTYQQSTFGAHFVEVAVDAATGEARLRRMLAVCAAGRILNPVSARSQVIGAMTMGIGAALMEGLAVDQRFGFFVNHDLAQYEIPVHADIPHLDVVFLDETDPIASPLKAKGVGELGICGAGAAVANAIYNATGVRIRDYPVTLDKYLAELPYMS